MASEREDEFNMTRADFLKSSLALAALSGARPAFSAAADELAPPKIDHKNVKPRNRRPYAGIDWATACQVNTTSHMHEASRSILDVVKKRNMGLLTISNYYPSGPTAYPLRDAVRRHGLPVTNWPVVYKGKLTAGPFDWNKIVGEWVNELPKEKREAWPPYPFEDGGKRYDEKSIPKDLLEAPNGEHVYFKLANGEATWTLHLCALGSTFMSGTFAPPESSKGLWAHGYCGGCGEFWGTAIDRMIDKLIVPDGGGVTINHPTWSQHRREFLLELLDWDPRVLGIEVLEAGVNSENYWDWVLSTGRQCYGFFVPDWSVDKEIFGVNVLVTPERTVRGCLKAYRDGNFYGAAHGLGELKFTSIAFDGKTVTASTDKPATFEIKTARGVVQTNTGTSVEWTVPKGGKERQTGPAIDVFARIKATAADGCGETLFSQAFMLT